MRIGKLAQLTGLSRDTIRFYEREHLIASLPSTAGSNDYRHYPDDLVERLEMITQAREVGFSVADLRRLLQTLDSLEDDPDAAERFLDEKSAELRGVISRSRRLLAMLQQTKAALARPPKSRHTGRADSWPQRGN